MAWKLVAGIKGLDEPAETLNYYGNKAGAEADAQAQQEAFAPDPEDGDIIYWVEEVKSEPRAKSLTDWDRAEWTGEDDA